MTIAAALILSRFVHCLALSVLFGCALFPFHAFARSDISSYLGLKWLRPLLLIAAVLTLMSGLSWYAFSDDESGAWAWPFRLSLAGGLVLLLLGGHLSARRFQVVLLGSLFLLASLAWTGHGAGESGAAAIQYRILDVGHLIASGVWIGALVVFSLLAAMPDEDGLDVLHQALARFSGIGTIVVATLVLTGIINPGFSSSLETPYGQILLVKLALFSGMLLLAAANRFWLTPKLSGTLGKAGAARNAMRALQTSLLLETVLGILILALVAWLGTLAPV